MEQKCRPVDQGEVNIPFMDVDSDGVPPKLVVVLLIRESGTMLKKVRKWAIMIGVKKENYIYWLIF